MSSICTLLLLCYLLFKKGTCVSESNASNLRTQIDGFLKFSESFDPFLDESESGSGNDENNESKYHKIKAKILLVSKNKNGSIIFKPKNFIGISDNKGKNKWHKWENLNSLPIEQVNIAQPKKQKHLKLHKSKHKDDIKEEFEIAETVNNYNNQQIKNKGTLKAEVQPTYFSSLNQRQFNVSTSPVNATKLEIANITLQESYTNRDIRNKSRPENLSDIVKYKALKPENSHKRQHHAHMISHKRTYKIFTASNNENNKRVKSKTANKRPPIVEVKNSSKLMDNKTPAKNKMNSKNSKLADSKKSKDNEEKTNEKSESKDNNKNLRNESSENNTNLDTGVKENLENILKQKNYTGEVNGTNVNSDNNPSKTMKKEEKNFQEVQVNLLENDKNVNGKDQKSTPKNENNVVNQNETQDEKAKKLLDSLRKLRFRNGASGHVRTGQEFAYISQCGLYTEPQNVSFVQHSWVTKTYSPYFYLYEKPKKYEKCKPSTWMNSTDMRGSVFLSFEVKSLHGSTMANNAKICEKYCCKEPRCAAWVLRLQSDPTSNCPANSYCCWLKTDIPKTEPHDDCVSGIVHREHYKHPPIGMRSAVPLGALGTGSFEMRADGTFHEWTIENQSPGGSAKLSKTSLEMMLLGVRVQKGTAKAKSAVLRTHAPHGFDSVEGLTYSGSFPVSKLKIDFHKSLRKDVDLNLYAYSTFHPRYPAKSATPAVAFSLDINNPSSETLSVSFMMNLPFGYNDDTIRRGNNFAEIAYTRLVTAADCQLQCANRSKCMAWTTNGPFSCMLKDGMPLHSYEYGIISGLKGEWNVKDGLLNCKRPGFYPQSGDISLYPLTTGSEESAYTVGDDPENIWAVFKEKGTVNNDTTVNITGLNGAVSVSTKLKPKESKILTIVLSWYFPNKDIAEERVGNFYNNLFSSSIEAAKHFEKDLTSSADDILKWQSTVMAPNQKKDELKKKEKKRDKARSNVPKSSCDSKVGDVEVFPECLQDILLNSLSTLRTGMWMENGRWRQWEAYDCANMDPAHVDFHRIIPYIMFYPEIMKQVMLAWADHQLSNGMIQESLSVGCLEETSKEGVAGGRMMTDVNVGFIVQAFMIYSWTNDTNFFDEIYPFATRAMSWLITESTKGTGLPYRKPDSYDLFELEKYDHCAYNSILYLLALRTMKIMANLKKDQAMIQSVTAALERAQKQFEIEMWDEHREFYHAWFDDEWGSPPWLMSDVLYGQVWAYTLGIGDLIDPEKMKKHLQKEGVRNDSPYGLRAISKSDNPTPIEDTSVILGDELNSCKSLENVTKTESVWMSASTDWSILQIHLGMDPKEALEQAIKSLNNYRVTLRDQWNFHGLTSSEHYGLDGLPWATSHYTFHLVLWHLPLALSGQQYFAPNGTLKFSPKYNVPYWLPFYLPQCMGNIEAKEEKTGKSIEVLYKLRVSLGSCTFHKVVISDTKYGRAPITLREGEIIEWSAPQKSQKDIVKAMLDQLKH